MKNSGKNYLFQVVTTALLLSSFLFSQTADTNESKIRKYEIGGQVTVLRQKSYQDDALVFDIDFSPAPNYMRLADDHQTEYGFGGRFTYNFNRNIALEAEANFFPVDRLSPTSGESERIFGTNEFLRVFVEPRGRKFQAVAGPKIGFRKEKYGVFAKIRPGIFHVGRFPVVQVLVISPGGIGANDQKSTFFSVDVGGVFELYPSKRTILRFDVGDTIIRYNAKDPVQFNPGFTRHTLQISTGFGFRF